LESIAISKKICMLGTFGVGKTSLVRRFVLNVFDETYLSTIGVNISQKSLPPHANPATGRSEYLNFIIWDIAHLEKFTPAYKNYFHGSEGAVVVYDLTRPQSVTETEKFLAPFLEINPASQLIFVGNKTDLLEMKSINLEPFLQFSKNYVTEFILTSARTGENVEVVFQKLGKLILKGN